MAPTEINVNSKLPKRYFGSFLCLLVYAFALAFAVVARADYPLVSHKYSADPTALEFNGRLYLYCSNDTDNGTNSYAMHSVSCFSSDDLKNWTDHGEVLQVPRDVSWATLSWAPSVISNNGAVYLYFANGAGSIGVATSSVPVGPFKDAKGNSLINSSTPGAASSTQWYFDPGAFTDTDGQTYLYFGGSAPTNSRVIRLGSNLTSVSGSATAPFATNFFEASHLHQRNGIYYLTYSTTPAAGMVIYCETNSNPTNGFVPSGTVLPNPPMNVFNNNHHSIVLFGGNWYIAYHNRFVAKANGLSDADAVYKRSLCLERLNYNADGSIQQVTPTTNGLSQLKNLNPYARVEAETIAQQSGLATEPCVEGGMDVTNIFNGNWLMLRGVDFTSAGATNFTARIASAGLGGTIELHLDATNGTLIGNCAVPVTGGWQTWASVSTTVSNSTAKGVHNLYLKFTGVAATNLFNLNYWQFSSSTNSLSPVSLVKFEAESGALGSDWAVSNSTSPAYMTITTDGAGNSPSNATRVATYTVTFPTPGTYQLYAHVRVGSGTFNDDSLFYGNGFGVKNPTNSTDWILVNGLGAAGFSNPTNIVNTSGTLGSGVWKWVNLSVFTPGAAFTVSATNLTQTFQIGAHENGLDLDAFEFGLNTYTYTVSNLDSGIDGTPPSPPIAGIDATKTFQTIEGLGGAICFYNGWVTSHPYKLEIYTNVFAGLNLSMLRLGNWFRYTNSLDSDAPDFVSNANRVLGHPVPVYMSSWSPPAFLKSNGQVGNGGTLITNSDGSFAYTNFANYWYDSIKSYQSNGVNLTWASIQNEPDWTATYDSCIFHPTEDSVNGTNYASYSKALDAVYKKLTNLPSPPKLLAPEVVHISYNDLNNYAATMNTNSFYGVAHHLYGDGSTTGDSFLTAISSVTNVFPSKPRFMTEYGDVFDMIECAVLIHNSLAVESVSGYNHWSLIWPGTNGGLIQIENPFASQSTWTNAPAGTSTQSHGWWYSPSYWSMKHFSYFIQPGYRRVAATNSSSIVPTSAFLSPDGLRLVAVFINKDVVATAVNVNFGSFPYFLSSVYQTAGTNKFQPLGSVGSQITLPAQSLTTVVLDKFVAVGAAFNPSPANGATNVAFNVALGWTPGSNAVSNAIFLGTDSNAVAQATTTSPQFLGVTTNNNFSPALSLATNYFWRVDEIVGANTNIGVLWSFAVAPLPTLVHRYSFAETGGVSVLDSVGGAAWTGTLPASGTLSGGQLTLASVSSQYASLPAGIVSTLTNFTIEAWVKLNSTANWTRIFDFGNNTTSYMYLTPQNGSTSRLRFGITTNGSGGEQQINGAAALTTGIWHHVAVTRNGLMGILYQNGVAVGTNVGMTIKPSNLGSTANNYLGKSQFADPYFNGSLDEFRIHSVALSAAEIAATYALGVNSLLSTNSPAIGLSNTPASLTLAWPLASAGFIVQSRTSLTAGSWVNVTSLAPQIIGGQWQVILGVSNSLDSTFYRLIK